MTYLVKIIIMVLLFVPLSGDANEGLLADLSEDTIRISADFNGAKLVLFGAIENPGDLVVVVTGPRNKAIVRRKDSVAGVWLNLSQVVFRDVPGYYAIASTRPLKNIKADSAFNINQVGIQNLRVEGLEELPYEERREWRDALFSFMVENGRYKPNASNIKVVDNKLFRTEIEFPSSTPTGTYTVDTLLIRSSKVEGAWRALIKVKKSGLGAKIYSFSYSHGLIFGIFAVFAAIAIGLAANEAAKRT